MRTFLSVTGKNLRRRAAPIVFRLVATMVLAGFLGVALVRLAPGFGVDERELDPGMNAGAIAALRGASEISMVDLLWKSFTTLVSGDWGVSETFQRPVRELISDRWSTTAASVGFGLAMAWVLALLWGGPGSLRSVPDWLGSAASFTLLALPTGLVAVAMFLAGAPVAVGIALAAFPQIYRFVRELTRAGWANPCVAAAAARGVGASGLLVRHVGALVSRPLLSVLGTSAATGISAAIPMESLCDSPGLGQLAFRACLARDLALLLPLILLITACVQCASAFADVVSDGSERAAAA